MGYISMTPAYFGPLWTNNHDSTPSPLHHLPFTVNMTPLPTLLDPIEENPKLEVKNIYDFYLIINYIVNVKR